MATVIISGRVDEQVKERAGVYIHAAGLTVGDVIKTMWENIAATGQLPEPLGEEGEGSQASSMGAFIEFCDSLSTPKPEKDWLAALAPGNEKDLVAEELLKKYECQ